MALLTDMQYVSGVTTEKMSKMSLTIWSGEKMGKRWRNIVLY